MNLNFKYNIHESFMDRAIEISKGGIGSVSPNPLVGCVLVKNGEIIGGSFKVVIGGSKSSDQHLYMAYWTPPAGYHKGLIIK